MMLPRRGATVGGGALGDQHPPPSSAASPSAATSPSTGRASRRHRDAPAAPTAQDDAVQARTRILDAAATLFAEHGFDGTPTARIARTAGVPKGLLFYYFATKPAILTALLTERLGVPEIDPATLAVPGDPVRALLKVGEWILHNHAASDVLREIIWHESHTRPEVGVALTRYRRGLHDTIEQVLVASLTAGVDETARVDETALRAAASAWSATITARPLVGQGADDLHGTESLRAIAELLCQGLLCQGLLCRGLPCQGLACEGLHAPTASRR